MSTRRTTWTARWISIVAGVALALLLAGCAVTLPSGDVYEMPVEEWVPSAPAEANASTEAATGAEPEPESEPTPEPVLFTLLPLSEGEPLRARDIFAQVSPAVAHVTTPNSTGSAVLVENNYLVTAAHVVWPHESVRVVFPDGTEFEELPVAAWDLMTDVALLGPVDIEGANITPLTFADGSDLPIGSEVYLIGYPAEFEEYPQPALGRGLLSRLREWDATGLSMFQVDADISGGQSGGVMVSEHGDLIGITNYRFTDSNSPMVTSAADVVPLLTAMLAGEPQSLADRRPMADGYANTHEGVLEEARDYDYYLLFAEAGDEVDLNVEGVGNPIVTVASIRGEILESSTPRAERTSGVATTVWGEGPYVVVVTQNSNNRNPYTLTGSHPLFAVDDPDDDRQLQFGDAYIGSIDNPADADHFTIDLRAGDRIVVEVESLTIDPVIVIRYESRGRVEVAFDDNSGPTGIFGVNARAVLVAPEDGEYTIFVDTYNDSAVGGYILNVSEGKWGDAVTETGFSLEHYLTSRGLFSRYMSDSFPFTMLYPANYEWGGEDCEDVTACFQSDTEYLGIMEASPSELTPSERDLDIMLNDLRMGMESGLGETEVLSRRDLTTHQGLDAKMESMTAYDGGAYIASFVFFDEEIGMFVGTFIIGLGADADLDAVEDFTEFLFSTVHVYDEERLADDVAFYLEQGMHQAAKGEYLSALGNLKFALTLNEELTEAHTLRAMIHANMGNYDLAVEYLDAALELEPDNVELLTSQAYLFWYLGDYEEALEQTDRIIELRPDAHSIYNERALYRASVGNYEGALAELAQYEEMAEDGLPANVLDTRAFVYLMSGDLEAALSDYEEILADDFQHPITLLGAGITFARLDRMDEAMPLLDYGMEKFEEGEYEIIDPQLTEILAWAEEILETENAQ